MTEGDAMVGERGIFPQLLVCEHCDTVCRRVPLARRQVARCERCDAVLYRARLLDVDQWLALTVAAGITFLIANVYPVLHLGFNGLQAETTVWGAMAALAHGAAAPIAVPAAFAAILVPAVQIGLLAWLLGFARVGRRAPGFDASMRMLVVLRPWSMIEVCLLGILVALVKLSNYFQVYAGPGLWATAASTVLIALIASRDLTWLWERMEPPAIASGHD